MNPRKSGARLAPAALVVGAIGISFSPILVRLSELGPTATAFHRVFLAAPLLWAVLLWSDRQAPAPPLRPARVRPRRREAWLLIAAGVAFAGDLGIWHWSVQLTSVANSTLLANLTPIFVTLAAWLLFGERIRGLFLVGLALALGGTAAMVRASFALDGAQVLGDALGVATALFYTAYLLLLKRLRQTLPTATIMLWTLALAPAMLLPIAAAAGETLLPQSTQGWLVVAGFALIGNIAGQSMMTYAFAHLPASFGAVTLLVVPVFAALFAWLLFGETVSAAQAIAGAAVLAGIVLAERGRRRPRDGRRGSRR